MWLFDRIFSRQQSVNETQWAEQLADEQLESVERQLVARSQQLGSLAEARGYLRARAVSVLRRGLPRVLPEGTSPSCDQQDRVVRQALHLLTERLANSLVAGHDAAASGHAA